MARVSVFPTTDVHLLVSAGGLAVELLAFVDGADVTTDPATTWTGNYMHLDFDPAVVQVVPGTGVVAFRPVAPGVTFGVVRHDPAGGERSEGVIRVWVHAQAEEFWIANRLLTLHAGRNDYVPTVMARFSDGAVGDVTDHPAFEYFSTDPAVFVAARAGGRVLGVAAGAAQLRVVHDPLGEQRVPVDIADALGPPRAILQRIRGDGRHDRRRNILFLPEGFVDGPGQQDRFLEQVERIAERLLTSSSHSPFPHLGKSFIVWAAWEPSLEPGPHPMPGITVAPGLTTHAAGDEAAGRPVPITLADNTAGDQPYDVERLTLMVGLPLAGDIPADRDDAAIRWLVGASGFEEEKLTDAVFQQWRRQRDPGFLPVRNSRFGLMMGARAGDPRSRRPQRVTGQAQRPNHNAWYRPAEPHRHVGFDPRRGSPSPGRASGSNPWPFLNEYFRTLRPRDARDPSAGLGVGERWRHGMEDEGLVCYVVDEQVRGATRFASGLGVTLGRQRAYSITTPGPRVDKDEIAYSIRPLESLVATVAHEFGHAFGLGDEYEGTDYPGTIRRPTAAEADAVEDDYTNITTLRGIAGSLPGRRLNVALIKWNHDRVSQASRVEATVARDAAGDIEVRLRTGQGRRWQKARDRRQDVFLRHPAMERKSGPVRITRITGDVLVIEPGPNMSVSDGFDFDAAIRNGGYPAGSALYQPKMSGAVPRTLIHPRVLARIDADDDSLAPHQGSCADYGEGREYPPDIAGFDEPRNSYAVIGLYEGGATWNCNVYRPAGMCKMRDSFAGEHRGKATFFCHVCKYILINAIDPTELSWLDREYPEDC